MSFGVATGNEWNMQMGRLDSNLIFFKRKWKIFFLKKSVRAKILGGAVNWIINIFLIPKRMNEKCKNRVSDSTNRPYHARTVSGRSTRAVQRLLFFCPLGNAVCTTIFLCARASFHSALVVVVFLRSAWFIARQTLGSASRCVKIALNIISLIEKC